MMMHSCNMLSPTLDNGALNYGRARDLLCNSCGTQRNVLVWNWV